MNRRAFIVKSIKVFFTALTVTIGFISFTFLYPVRVKKGVVKFFPVMDEEDLPKKGVKMVIFPHEKGGYTVNTRVFIVSHLDSLFALSPVCTHLGCLVNWNRAKNSFLCFCHGGRYDIEGNVISGPPPAPLTRLPIKVEQGRVYIGLKALNT